MLVVWVMAFVPVAAQTREAREYEVKAAFIYNFIRFVEWPTTRFDSADAPFVVCVAGKNPFGAALDDLLDSKSAHGRRITTTALDVVDPRASACHVTFVGAPESAIRNATDANSHPGVLTVGEGRGFVDAGGIIALTVSDRKVRFIVNLQRSELAGLEISSQLLSLAEVVGEVSAGRTIRDETR